MDLKEIKQILRMMDLHGLVEFTLERKGEKLSLRKPGSGVEAAPGQMAIPAAPPAPAAVQPPAPPPAPAAPPAPAEDDKLHVITSPMVGTFYAAPSPDSPTFVSIGTQTGPDTVVCIIEAMKIMNEIKADVSGTVEQVCVKNGQPVEFGQPLFRVRLS
ncbi:acetyl-CoA carboxylase biotin carboxyl carrier protein [bacterium]|nr:acetyl-CoA carboxylase biotin carboxyl carrier protein [bacterium]